MIHTFTGETANEVWGKAYKKLTSVNVPTSESRNGKTDELLHSVLAIENPIERWVTYRTPPLSIAFALAEIIWIMSGSNESKVINYWNPLLKKFSGDSEYYHGAYGYRIRNRYEMDQLDRAYLSLKNNPDSRQNVILIWNPEDDLPEDDGKPKSSDIPCNICSMLKIRNSKLEWTQILRSNDIFKGVPYNFVQFTAIQEILAGWLGVGVGSYTQFSDSLHLYESDRDILSIKVKEVNPNSDRLIDSKVDTEKIICEIFRRMKLISENNLEEKELKELIYLNSNSEAYNNIMLIIGAYASNKKGYVQLLENSIEDCTNNLYCNMWNDWKR